MASKFVIELNASVVICVYRNFPKFTLQYLAKSIWYVSYFHWILRFESCFKKLFQQKGFCTSHNLNLFSISVLKSKVSKHSMSLHLSLVAKDPVTKKKSHLFVEAIRALLIWMCLIISCHSIGHMHTLKANNQIRHKQHINKLMFIWFVFI